MGNSLLAVRDINHKYIVVRKEKEIIQKEMEQVEEKFYIIAEKNWGKIKKRIYEEIEKRK